MNIRYAGPNELHWIRNLADLEGWNPGLDDMRAFYAQDRQGFLIGEVESRKIGCVSCIKYSGGFGFLGFYIVVPEERGKGYGLQLFNRALNEMLGCCIGLDGVFTEQQNYAKSGFELAYRNLRYEYVNQLGPVAQPTILSDREIPFARLEEFDRQHFLYERPAFLQAWLASANTQTRVCIIDGEILGYGCMRKCNQGYKIGPLFARSSEVAEELLISLCSSVEPGSAIYIDIPEPNQAALDLAARYHMRSVFGTARMYKGAAPALPINNIFGVSTFELG